MHVASPQLVVTGGCALQRAALSEWLHAQGFRVAPSSAEASTDEAPIDLLLCSEHDSAQELASFAASPSSRRKIAVLSCSCDRALSVARARGIANVFCADDSPDRLAVAIRAVHAGFHYQSPSFEQFIARDPAADHAAGPQCRVLTPRELDVLRLLAQGLSKKRIAETLHLSVKTVDNHSTSIMSKLDIHNRVDLARYAIREGLATA
ncbi:MAG: response regulator transcription factor [Phycisphaerales bacterium]|nr:response regulator transcription factor [Phycisphaerales bacterium]